MVASYPLLSQAPTQVEVELGCDNKHTNTSLATAAKIVLTIEPVWFRTWFRMGQSFFVLTVTVGSKRKTE